MDVSICSQLWKLLIITLLLNDGVSGPKHFISSNPLELRDKVLEMFNHAYNAYMKHAYPADELMPIACKGRVRGITPTRGDVDDALGNFSLTLVDTLDTLAVLGLYDEFEDAVKKVERDVSFDADLTVSVFETNIRMLGGLLGGHSAALELQHAHGRMRWYNGSLLHLAKQLGDKLLPAFNTSSGIPMSRINLLTGAVRKKKDKDTCTACAGTMLLEMAALSRFTGDPIYESKARAAVDYLWSRRQRSSDLMGTVLNVENGEWIRKESGIGAGIDSYYEYLLKAYIFLGDETFLERFNTHYQAIKQYCSQGPLVIDVLMHRPTTSARNFVDALSAFWPGLQVLKGDVKSAIETHELLYQVFTRHTFLPEAFTTNFDIHWGQYPLRPEFAESTYLLYKATGDPYYIEVGKTIVENLENKARVECGFAGIKDVRTFKHEDRMDSYFLAEMFKYLYLLFTPSDYPLGIDIDDYVLTTEAHILPLKLSLKTVFNGNFSFDQATAPVNPVDNFERSCPNTPYVRGGSSEKLEELRAKNRAYTESLQNAQPMCSNQNVQRHQTITWDGTRQLRANEFTPGNKRHLSLLQNMGISVVMLNDGKVQLLQQSNSAKSMKDATEGALFMKEMMELTQNRDEIAVQPLHIQLVSHPYMGSLSLRGSPAQFGPSFENLLALEGEVALAEPYDACSSLVNPDAVKGKVAVVYRGQCMFVQKAKRVEEAGAIAIVIVDNTETTSFDESPPFQMAGDDATETNIPAVFLFGKEGGVLIGATKEKDDQLEPLRVLISNRLKTLTELLLENRLSDRNKLAKQRDEERRKKEEKKDQEFESDAEDQIQDENVASRSDENVASRSDENVASRSDENVASRSDENVASRSDENVASRSDENMASRSDENVASRSDENVASRSDENMASRSDENVASRSDENVASRSDENVASRSDETSETGDENEISKQQMSKTPTETELETKVSKSSEDTYNDRTSLEKKTEIPNSPEDESRDFSLSDQTNIRIDDLKDKPKEEL